MTPFNLEIITPNRVFFKGQTENVIVRTTIGDTGILARHESYAAALGTGKVRVMIDGKYRNAAVSAGIVKVKQTVASNEAISSVTILAQSCEWGDEIDVERAEKAKQVAEQRLADASKLSENELAIAEFKLKRALNRLNAAEK